MSPGKKQSSNPTPSAIFLGRYAQGMVGVAVVLGVLAIAIGIVFVSRSRWAATRGWVFNKHNPRPRGSGAKMLLGQIYQPGIEHVVDEQVSQQTQADQSESGEKPASD